MVAIPTPRRTHDYLLLPPDALGRGRLACGAAVPLRIVLVDTWHFGQDDPDLWLRTRELTEAWAVDRSRVQRRREFGELQGPGA